MKKQRPHRIMAGRYLVDCRKLEDLTVVLALWQKTEPGAENDFERVGVQRLPSCPEPIHLLMARETERGLDFGFRSPEQSICDKNWKPTFSLRVERAPPLQNNSGIETGEPIFEELKEALQDKLCNKLERTRILGRYDFEDSWMEYDGEEIACTLWDFLSVKWQEPLRKKLKRERVHIASINKCK